MGNTLSRLSRRSFLSAAAGGVIASPMLIRASTAAAKSGSVTAVNYGGYYQDATVQAVYAPFTAETGIKVVIVPPSGLDKIKAMELTGNVDLDVFLGTNLDAASGSKRGFWEKLDPAIFDLEDLAVQPGNDHVTYEVAGRGVSWDPKKFAAGKHPRNFVEFFDLQRFPGRRIMRANVTLGTLETALVADGVAPKEIYPLDLDRAFKSLDRIKSQTIWAATTLQDTSLLQNGEADFGLANNNRVWATNKPGGGVPLACSLEQNVTVGTDLAIPKGAPNKENAMKLIAYYLRTDVQAKLSGMLGTIPVSKKAVAMLSPETRRWQPDLNNPNNVALDGRYWAENFEMINRRFAEWRMS